MENLSKSLATAFRPIDSWRGTILKTGPFETDGHSLFRVEACNPTLLERLRGVAWTGGRTTNRTRLLVREQWDKYVAAATFRVGRFALEYSPRYDPTTGKFIPVLLMPEGARNPSRAVVLSNRKLRLAERLTGYDEIRMTRSVENPVVLYRAGKPVGLVMPLRPYSSNNREKLVFQPLGEQ